jgi:hypothetical protein
MEFVRGADSQQLWQRNRICATAASWRDAGTLDADAYDQALAYFRQRYRADGDFTYHFRHLHLRPKAKHGQNDRAIAIGRKNYLFARLIAFNFSGRFSVMMPTLSSTW